MYNPYNYLLLLLYTTTGPALRRSPNTHQKRRTGLHCHYCCTQYQQFIPMPPPKPLLRHLLGSITAYYTAFINTPWGEGGDCRLREPALFMNNLKRGRIKEQGILV